ncbi:MAG: hypothetical protein MJ200_00795 [Mycoplasmoidaceae bacterium]|nr:hypothetical protein [Mycoplasmoidaceae bacterium]
MQILQNSCLNKFVLRNDFNFTTNTGKPVVGITHRLINDISDFKEVIF